MTRTSAMPKPRSSPIRTQEFEEADLSILSEVLCAAELVLLHAAPSYYGLPMSVTETAVYSESDGIVDWRYCKTERPAADFSVSGTHLGLAFNPSAYSIIAGRLAQAGPEASR